MPTPEQLTLAGVLAAAVLGLWKVVLDYIGFLRTETARLHALLDGQTTAINRLADGIEKQAGRR